MAALALLAACTAGEDGGSSPSGAVPALSVPPGSDEQVVIQDRAFSTEELTITEGTTVSWVNEDDAGHTITHGENGGPVDEPLFDEELSRGATVSYTFEDPGTYPVTCRIHPEMQMTITVEESSS